MKTQIHNINLVKSIPNRKIRDEIVRVFYGIIPCDGKQRSIQAIKDNWDRYSQMASDVDKKNSLLYGRRPLKRAQVE